MKQSSSSDEQDQTVFLQLAELVNSLPPEKRVSIRHFLGEYTHDLKHLIGLVTGANALITRQQSGNANSDVFEEMLAMIEDAAKQIDSQIDRLTVYLSQRISLD
jgi:hypothetical protein